MRWPRSRLLRALLVLAAVYLLGSLLLAVFANTLMFRPPPPGYRDGGDTIKLRTSDGAHISARYLPNPTAKYTVLFSHGKRDDLATVAPFLQRLHDWGYAVLAYDYHGYGTSEGKPSEENAYRDIAAAYDYLTAEQHLAPARIIPLGHSLGTGPTVDLATRRPAAGVILDSPYTSAGRVLTWVRMLPFDRFDNLRKIARVSSPLLFLHRKDDRVVPFRQGLTLYQAARSPKQCYWVERGGHEAIYRDDGPAYRQRLAGFCRLVEDLPAPGRN